MWGQDKYLWTDFACKFAKIIWSYIIYLSKLHINYKFNGTAAVCQMIVFTKGMLSANATQYISSTGVGKCELLIV